MGNRRVADTQHAALRWTALPPLMIYLAAGLSGLTNIVGVFYVKDHLGLSAEFIAALGFWASLPWSLKIAFGHVVDLIWRYKAWLVVAGAALVAGSMLIMLRLLADRHAMEAWMPVEAWYVSSALLAPVGYVLQDVVADAMTVEAVPRVDGRGQPVTEARLKAMHTTMQAWARGTIIAGSVLVSMVNLILFQESDAWSTERRTEIYQQVYHIGLMVPLISVLGVAMAGALRTRGVLTFSAVSMSAQALQCTPSQPPRPRPDHQVLGGGIALAGLAGGLGLAQAPHAELIMFAASLGIMCLLMRKVMANIDPYIRNTLVGTAFALFVYRAMPDPGPAPTWWIIDRLGVDEAFLAMLSLIGGLLALAGLFMFRHFMAERSVAFTIVALTLVWTVLSLPTVGLYYGLHEWSAALTGGVVDGRTIVVADTVMLSLLSEIAMVPMLAWIARTAPANLKATYFAVMISFTNLGFLLSRIGSEYLNRMFVITREIRDAASGTVITQADYSQLGPLYITTMLCTLLLPLFAIQALRGTRYRSA